jgi:hypothetical protein
MASLLAITAGCGSDLPQNVTPDTQQVAVIRERLQKSVTAGDTSSEQVALAGPAGFATIRGKFTMDGAVPGLNQIDVTKDATICAPGGKAVFDENLAVDPASKGIANVLVFLDKIPEAWIHPDARSAAQGEVVFDQKECEFLTRVVAVNIGQKLKVLNSDPVGHNLMVKNFNETIPAGQESYFQSNKADSVPQKMACAVHPWMKAWFMSRDDMYFAVTNPDGTFEIPHVPAGVELIVKVWHERTNFINGQVSVNGQAETWKKGRRALKVDPDSTAEMDVVLNSSMF